MPPGLISVLRVPGPTRDIVRCLGRQQIGQTYAAPSDDAATSSLLGLLLLSHLFHFAALVFNLLLLLLQLALRLLVLYLAVLQ